MKQFLTNLRLTVLILVFLGFCVWICLNPWFFAVMIIAAYVLGPVLAGLAAVFSSKPPPTPPAPIRQPDTLTPLLIGLALGWWLGGGPGDGGDC
jgi:hypothetical protein